MIKEIIIKCDDEQTKAHNEWLKEETEIIDMLDHYIDTLREGSLKNDLVKVRKFIKRGEM